MWSCSKCHFESSTSTDWLDHLRDRHQQQFPDSLASAAIATACRKISKPVKEEKCLLCDEYPSNTRRALVAHIGKHMEEVAMMALPKDHTDDSGHSSESDDGNFDIDDPSNGDNRNEHAGSKETGLAICLTPGCGGTFDNEEDLDAHMDAHVDAHMATRPGGFKCAYCSESFTRDFELRLHLQEHSLEKPYSCGSCEARFQLDNDLKRHAYAVHFRCPECDRPFAHKAALVKHVFDPKGCSIDEEDLSSRPRCQRCRTSKKGCDRQRPCGHCKDAGIGPEGCMPEGDGSGRKGRYGRHMGVSVRKDSSFQNIADTSSNSDNQVQNQNHELNLWPPGRLEDDFDFDDFLNEVEDPGREVLSGLNENVNDHNPSAKREKRPQKDSV